MYACMLLMFLVSDYAVHALHCEDWRIRKIFRATSTALTATTRTLQCDMALCLIVQSKPYIRRALSVLAHEDNLPSVIHCTHGKDRTGLLVALLLLMLGVEEGKVVADYVASEEELKVSRINNCLRERDDKGDQKW